MQGNSLKGSDGNVTTNVQLNEIEPGSASDGQTVTWNGTEWAPASVPSYVAYGYDASLNGATNQQMKTVDGALVSGYRMPVDGNVTHISAQFDCSSVTGTKTVTFELVKNGSQTGKTVVKSVSTNTPQGVDDAITAESFSAGDQLTVYITHEDSNITTEDHAVLLRTTSP